MGGGHCPATAHLRLPGRTVRLDYENPWRLVAARRRNDNWWTLLKRARTFVEAQGP